MLFGTSGIRGEFGTEITPELALDVARAACIGRKRVLVGRDARTSSEILAKAAISGILAAGADCIDCGLVPTPALSYATKSHGDAGIMITASHNPPQDNGLKLFQNTGMSFQEKHELEIEECLEKRQFPQVSWDACGSYSKIDANEEYINKIVSSVKIVKKLKVVIDPGNGVASLATPEIFKRLGCEVSVINSELNGTFSSRPSEPEEKNLSALKEAVKNKKANLGIAQDGDGDRHAIIDEKGNFVDQDKLLALIYKEYGGKLVTTIDGSMILDSIAGKGNVIRTKVGDVAVAEEILKSKAAFGGESSSGCWIHPKVHLGPDGPLSAAIIAAVVAERGPISKLIEDMPDTFMHRKKYAVKDKENVMGRIGAILREKNPLTVDGYRVDEPEGWYLIRPSGTENLIRISVEGRTIKDADNLLKVAEKVLENAR